MTAALVRVLDAAPWPLRFLWFLAGVGVTLCMVAVS